MFQVSEAFSKDIEEVLLVQGIRSQAIVRRREQSNSNIPPITLPTAARRPEYLESIARSVGIGANLVTIGAAVAGLASCSVM